MDDYTIAYTEANKFMADEKIKSIGLNEIAWGTVRDRIADAYIEGMNCTPNAQLMHSEIVNRIMEIIEDSLLSDKLKLKNIKETILQLRNA